MASAREHASFSYGISGVFAAAAVMALFAASVAAATEPAGRVISTTGQVTATSSGQEPRVLKTGDAVAEGDVIRSDRAASAKLLMGDRTILDVNPSSQLVLEHYQVRRAGDRDVSLSLDGGTVRASVTQHLAPKAKFTIRTRTCTMGVRGTEFVVQDDAKKGQSQLTVLKGLVQATSPGQGSAPVGVAPGNQLTATAGAAPTLTKLAPEQLAAITRVATVQDRTFRSAVEIRKSSARAGGAAALSAMRSFRGFASRSPASRPAAGVVSAVIPGKTDSLYTLRTQAVAPQSVMRVNVGFVP